MKVIASFTILCTTLVILTGCKSYNGPGYGDRKVTFSSPPPKPVQQPCDMRGNIVSRSDAACVGKVIKSPDGPTITVLSPGLAVPMADVDAASLEPPKR